MIIGIEVELHSDNYSADDIAKNEWLNFNTFTYLKWMSIWVKLSREYYSSTIEYNFTPFENNLEKFKEVKEFLELQINKYNLYKHCSWPSYVWTHIHIFDEDRINMRIKNLLEWVSWFLIENISLIDKKGIQRLLFAHQLWGHYSWKNNHIWRQFLNDKWRRPEIYDNTREKPKYSPIINSLANADTWKPKSLEIRIIPNEFIFNLRAYELINLIDKKNISKYKKDVLELYNVLYNTLYWNNSIKQPGNIQEFLLDNSELQWNTDVEYKFNNKLYSEDKIRFILNYIMGSSNANIVISAEEINWNNYVDFLSLLIKFKHNNIISSDYLDVITKLSNYINERFWTDNYPF